MKKIIIHLLLFYSYHTITAQKIDTLTTVERKYTTAEQVLGLPTKDTVLKCDIVIRGNESGSEVMARYAKDGYASPSEAPRSKDFSKLWQSMMEYVTSGKLITIDKITVQKHGKAFKWTGKTFIVP